MLYTYGTRPMNWYAAPPEDDMTEDEREKHDRQVTAELDAWCRRTVKLTEAIEAAHEKLQRSIKIARENYNKEAACSD